MFVEQLLPVHFARLDLRGGRAAAVRASERRPHAEALLGEIQAGAGGIAADAAEFAPDEMRGVDSPLPHQIQGQPTEIVLRQRRGHRGALAPAFAHRPRHIVFAAS